MVRVRPYEELDSEFVLGLAHRLTIGMPSWRDREAIIATTRNWIKGSIERRGEKAEMFVAVGPAGERWGFATISEQSHFTGESQAYIGELAVLESAEGKGVGKALVASCEAWSRDHGLRVLALATGAGNAHALDFYHHLGFLDEDVKLVKILR